MAQSRVTDFFSQRKRGSVDILHPSKRSKVLGNPSINKRQLSDLKGTDFTDGEESIALTTSSLDDHGSAVPISLESKYSATTRKRSRCVDLPECVTGRLKTPEKGYDFSAFADKSKTKSTRRKLKTRKSDVALETSAVVTPHKVAENKNSTNATESGASSCSLEQAPNLRKATGKNQAEVTKSHGVDQIAIKINSHAVTESGASKCGLKSDIGVGRMTLRARKPANDTAAVEAGLTTENKDDEVKDCAVKKFTQTKVSQKTNEDIAKTQQSKQRMKEKSKEKVQQNNELVPSVSKEHVQLSKNEQVQKNNEELVRSVGQEQVQSNSGKAIQQNKSEQSNPASKEIVGLDGEELVKPVRKEMQSDQQQAEPARENQLDSAKVADKPKLDAGLQKKKLGNYCNLAELKKALTRGREEEKRLKAVASETAISEKNLQFDEKTSEKVTETKKPAYERYSCVEAPTSPTLTLPTSYYNLLETFSHCDWIVSMLHRRSELCTFTKLQTNVERVTNRKFELKYLGQFKTVLPSAYHFRQEKDLPSFGGKVSDYQLTIAANLEDASAAKDSDADKKQSATAPAEKPQFTVGKHTERKNSFWQNLLNIVNKYHTEFLRKFKLPMEFNEKELLHWHPKFKLDSVPEVEVAPLPEAPIRKKPMTAQEMLDQAKNMFLDKKVKLALEKTASYMASESGSSPSTKECSKPKSPETKTVDNEHNKPSTSSKNKKPTFEDILQRVREKEQAAKKEMSFMTRNTADKKRLARLQRLPELSRRLGSTYRIDRHASGSAGGCMTMARAVQVISYTGIEPVEATEYINLLTELVPEWITIRKGLGAKYVHLDLNLDFNTVLNKLQKVADEF